MTQDPQLSKAKPKGGVKPEQKGIFYPDRTHSCVNFLSSISASVIRHGTEIVKYHTPRCFL